MSETFYQAVDTTAYVEIVDGNLFDEFGVQLSSQAPVRIAVAASLPSPSTTNFVILSGAGDKSVGFAIDSTDNVYAMGFNAPSAVRGWKGSR